MLYLRSFIFSVSILFASAFFSLQVIPSAHAAGYEDAARLVVMIDCEEQGSSGAGVIFALRGDSALVFTANHIIRSGSSAAKRVKVYFKDAPNTFVNAQVLSEFDAAADLALIEVSGLAAAGLDHLANDQPLLFELFGSSKGLQRGDGVFPVGFPGGIGWGSPVKPDAIDRREPERILFQSAYVAKGHSGGALFDRNWRLVGMVLQVAQSPTVAALPIEAILDWLRIWDFGIGVQQAAPERASALTSSLNESLKTPKGSTYGRALVEESTNNGRTIVRPTAWTSIAEEVEESWVTLSVSGIQGLPPIDHPRFYLSIESPAFPSAEFDFNYRETSFVTRPIPIKRINRVSMQVKDRVFFHPDTRVTPSWQPTLKQLLDGQVLRLPYSEEVVQMVRTKTKESELRLVLKAWPFDPEGNSGANQYPGSPTMVLPATLVNGAVDFEGRNATDYLSIAADGGPCGGLLLLFGIRGATTVVSSPVDKGIAANTPSVARFSQLSRTGLFDVKCTPGGLLRVRANGLGSNAAYILYLARGTPDRKALSVLVTEWLDSAFLEIDHRAGGDPTELLRGISLMLEQTATDYVDLANVYDTILSRHAKYEVPMSLLEKVIKPDRDKLETALVNCCNDLHALRFLINLQRAESGLPFDKGSLDWFKCSNNCKFQERIKKVLERTRAN